MRSGSYAAAWRPRSATVLAVRGFSEAEDGTRTVISHMVKRIRGEVARIVLAAGADPEAPQDVAALVTAAGLDAELDPDSGTLNVIERA
jgi:cytoplasmic iron level regulating protein YaaA (DUF328/UPF0246 family)